MSDESRPPIFKARECVAAPSDGGTRVKVTFVNGVRWEFTLTEEQSRDLLVNLARSIEGGEHGVTPRSETGVTGRVFAQRTIPKVRGGKLPPPTG